MLPGPHATTDGSNDALGRELADMKRRIGDLARTLATIGGIRDFTVGTVVQSASVAYTLGYARFTQIGGMVFGHCRLSFTAAGTAGNAILINVTGLPDIIDVARLSIGGFLFDDASVAPYVGVVTLDGTATQFSFNVHNSAGNLGVVPNFAIASGDSVNFSFEYPVV
jgi:hypothetical protein